MHSPFLAEHSIGKLHLMQLSDQLVKDNFNALDLTPGSDPWKERFANAHDEVAEMTIYNSSIDKILGVLKYKVQNAIRHLANKVRITSGQLKVISKTVKSHPLTMLGHFMSWIYSANKYTIYQIDREKGSAFQSSEKVNCNSLSDLIAFEAGNNQLEVSTFLSFSLQRLEAGEKVYTYHVGEHLYFCCWFKINQNEDQLMGLPSNSVLLHDLLLRVNSGDGQTYRNFIEHLVQEAFTNQEIQHTFFVIPTRHRQLRLLLEDMGFFPKSSYKMLCKFGKEKRVE